MLRHIKLCNFRKHESLSVSFANGLNAIKGANEAGKSTIILAALYALYGSKALPLPLAKTVTWGKKESELSVELTIEVDGRLFTFTRSKSGAEAAYDGGLVTGQNEVSSFASEVLGGDRDLVCRLMLANQANLRGALEDGPKAVSTMIESLADFDLFDRIVDAAQQRLTLGPTSALEEKVRQRENEVAQATPEPPNVDGLLRQIAEEQGRIETLENLIRAEEPQKAAAEAAYASEQTNKRMREGVETNLRKARENQKLHEVQKAEADEKASIKVDEAEIVSLKQQLDEASAFEKRSRVYQEFSRLVSGYPDAFWEGTKESFTAELADREKAREGFAQDEQHLRDRIKDLERDIAVLEAQVITASTCPTCGTDVSKNPTVVAKNEALGKQIAELKDSKLTAHAQASSFATAKHGVVQEITALKGVASSAAPFERFATQYGEFVTVNLDTYPPTLEWRGVIPEGDSVDTKAIQNRIVQAESAKEAAERANARSVALSQTLQEDAEYIARLEQQLADCPEVGDLDALHAEARRLGNAIATYRIQIESVRKNISDIERQKAEAEADYRVRLEQRAAAESELKKAQEELERLIFNNTLLKKVRAARPVISDRLWSMTLAAVSTMFTTMRGEKSVVTKDKDGFAVNGEPVQGLSGSTLDILGLSIRCALIKTFLPHVSFLALDEPASGCDDNRTAALLGFIASSGFQQVLVVSHEEATEAAADHVITI